MCCSILPSRQLQNPRLQHCCCITARNSILSGDPIVIVTVAAVFAYLHSNTQLVANRYSATTSEISYIGHACLGEAKIEARGPRASKPSAELLLIMKGIGSS